MDTRDLSELRNENQKRLRSAIKKYKKTLAELNHKSNPDLVFALATAYYDYACSYKGMGDNLSAEAHFFNAVQQFSDPAASDTLPKHERRLVGQCYYQLALCHLERNMISSIELINKAGRRFLSTEIEYARCCYIKGLILTGIAQVNRKYTQAIHELEQAKQHLDAFNDHRGIANCYYRLAEISYFQKNYRLAIDQSAVAIGRVSLALSHNQDDLESRYVSDPRKLMISCEILHCKALHGLQQHPLAMEKITGLLALQMEDSLKRDCFETRAHFYLAEKNYPAALADFKEVFQLNRFFFFKQDEIRDIKANHPQFYSLFEQDKDLLYRQSFNSDWFEQSTPASLIAAFGSRSLVRAPEQAGHETTAAPLALASNLRLSANQ